MIDKIVQEFEEKFTVLEKGNSDGSFTLEVGQKIETSDERASSYIRNALSTLISKQIEAIEGEKQDILDETPVDIWEKQVSYNEGINRAIGILKTFK